MKRNAIVQTENDILSFDIPDDALERAAAVAEGGSASRSEFAPTGLLASGRFRRRSAAPLRRRLDGRRASGARSSQMR